MFWSRWVGCWVSCWVWGIFDAGSGWEVGLAWWLWFVMKGSCVGWSGGTCWGGYCLGQFYSLLFVKTLQIIMIRANFKKSYNQKTYLYHSFFYPIIFYCYPILNSYSTELSFKSGLVYVTSFITISNTSPFLLIKHTKLHFVILYASSSWL